MQISIIGLGFAGKAICNSFKQKNIQTINIYDKYKNGGVGSLESCLNTNIILLVLPTEYNNITNEYDKSAIYETCDYLAVNNYNGVIVLKSTVEPETTNKLSDKYPTLEFVHNPEFLTARTAFEDFHNQTHIVLGKGNTCSNEKLNLVGDFYSKYYPDAEISICTALESESMKIFCNSFYAVKIQFFTGLYLLCEKNGCDFSIVKNMMLKNKWINPMHTNIPGPDGNISFGGACFPKDTRALNAYMEKLDVPNAILKNTIEERNTMREDNNNCK